MPQSLLVETTQANPEETMSQGRIYRREGSRYWWIAYYHHGKQQREVARYLDKKKKGIKIEASDETRAAAANYLKHRADQMTAERFGGPSFIGPEQERIKVNEILDDLVEHYKRGGKRGI